QLLKEIAMRREASYVAKYGDNEKYRLLQKHSSAHRWKDYFRRKAQRVATRLAAAQQVVAAVTQDNRRLPAYSARLVAENQHLRVVIRGGERRGVRGAGGAEHATPPVVRLLAACGLVQGLEDIFLVEAQNSGDLGLALAVRPQLQDLRQEGRGWRGGRLF